MRLIATAVACVLAAFGAAFLVGRAANNHPGSATAATVTTIHTASRPAPVATTAPVNRALAAQFEPGLHGLRHRPKRHRRRVAHPATPAPVTPSAPASTQTVVPAPTPAPTYSAPPRTTAPPTTSHHKSGGSGTTTIG